MDVEEALAVLLAARRRELSVKEAVEMIELVGREPGFVREVLRRAEEKGILRREGRKVYIEALDTGFPSPRVLSFECESSCRRCGARIRNCYFIELGERRLGPFGSSCVRRLL